MNEGRSGAGAGHEWRGELDMTGSKPASKGSWAQQANMPYLQAPHPRTQTSVRFGLRRQLRLRARPLSYPAREAVLDCGALGLRLAAWRAVNIARTVDGYHRFPPCAVATPSPFSFLAMAVHPRLRALIL
jgi:hypothetical protein